jgi:hypothetical protein
MALYNRVLAVAYARKYAQNYNDFCSISQRRPPGSQRPPAFCIHGSRSLGRTATRAPTRAISAGPTLPGKTSGRSVIPLATGRAA